MHGSQVDLLSRSGVYQLRQRGSRGRREEESRGWRRRRRGKEATDCQIAVWQSSVASGTVTTAAAAASVVVAVR